ncbi:MAG: aspartate aminotransferase [Proteobacteria bacterium]|nr:MAG: aspartate aminotransferase [Pseudomonadota bacterium]
MLSKRIGTLSESLTIAISAQARSMKEEGKNVISFSAGEPDFDTPQIVKDAAISAINNGFSKYTAVPGIPDVLDAIKTKLKKDHGLEYKADQIITNVGAKQSLFNIIQALVDEGDQVIIPAPYWVTYPELVLYSGGKPVIVETDEKSGFKITKEQLQNAISKKTKTLILNTPSNPTGSVYTKEELASLGEALEGTDIVVISDEMYEKLTYDMEFCSVASVSEDLFKRTITVNGLSKCAAMTGWRFGYMASPLDELNASIKKLQSQSTSNICSIVQYAAIPALLGKADKDIEYMKKAFQQRRDFAVEEFNKIEGISVLKPNGAFYLYVNISKIEKDSMKFCKDLLAQKGVATVPGLGFGMDGYMRFSFATDMDSIKEGIKRIKEFVL